MLTPVNLRFAQLIQEVGLSKNAFAQSLGKTASVIQHLIDGRNKPGYDLLCKVFEVYPNVSKDWLMEGTGPMLLAGAPVPAAPVARAAPAVALKKTAENAPLFAAPAVEETLAEETPGGPAASAPLLPPAAVAPAPVAPVASAPAAAPAAEGTVGAALHAQQLLHQLAVAELRNQHLLEQQQLLRQMLELAQRR